MKAMTGPLWKVKFFLCQQKCQRFELHNSGSKKGKTKKPFSSLLHMCYLATQSTSSYKSISYCWIQKCHQVSENFPTENCTCAMYIHVQCTSVNCLLLINFRFVKGKAITESLQFVMKNERYQTMQTNKSKVAPGKKAWPDNNWT